MESYGCFFGQGISYQDWLKDQKHNAWNYGWNFGLIKGFKSISWKRWTVSIPQFQFGQLKRHLVMALGCGLIFFPVVFIFSRDAGVQGFYREYFPPVDSLPSWAYLLGTLLVYMLCWEWFFRGYMLFGIAQVTGPVVAIVLQAVLFGVTHYGKDPREMWSAFAGGLVLGTLAWREKSFVPAFLIHAIVHITLALLVLR